MDFSSFEASVSAPVIGITLAIAAIAAIKITVYVAKWGFDQIYYWFENKRTNDEAFSEWMRGDE